MKPDLGLDPKASSSVSKGAMTFYLNSLEYSITTFFYAVSASLDPFTKMLVPPAKEAQLIPEGASLANRFPLAC